MNALHKATLLCLASLSLLAPAVGIAVAGPLPNPHIVNSGKQVEPGGTRYKIAVFNRAAYPNAMFVAAPSLPPCGLNHNSARTWVNVYSNSAKLLQGFCALKAPKDLGYLWFFVPNGQAAPPSVYVVMTDRATHTSYTSNALVTGP